MTTLPNWTELPQIALGYKCLYIYEGALYSATIRGQLHGPYPPDGCTGVVKYKVKGCTTPPPDMGPLTLFADLDRAEVFRAALIRTHSTYAAEKFAIWAAAYEPSPETRDWAATGTVFANKIWLLEELTPQKESDES